MKKLRLYTSVSFLFAMSLAGCGGSGNLSTIPRVSSLQQQSPAQTDTAAATRFRSSLSTVTNGASANYTAIDAGGAATGNWIADTDFNMGTVYSVARAIDTSRVSNPAPQSVYQVQRWATNLIYTIPHLTPNATYNVRLHFAETYFTAAGKRKFNAQINGKTVLANFDIFADAGAGNVADIKSFVTTASASGTVTVAMTATTNNATIAGIEVSMATAPGITINAGGPASGSWAADTDYAGGWPATSTQAVDTSHVVNAAPAAAYLTQRTGTSIVYTIPNLTPAYPYSVRLHFAESFFSSSQQRTFNVAINNSNVLSDFDIFAAAGGQNIAIAKSFVVNSDSSGKIAIALNATKNNATIAALEVDPVAGSAQPSPSPAPSPSNAPAGPSAYYNYSAAFTGNTPFHHTVAALVSGYAVKDSNSDTEVNNWIHNPYGHMTSNQPYQGGTFYIGKSSDQLQTWNGLNEYGSGDTLQGQQSHVPSYAVSQDTTDHHLIIDDAAGSSGGGEYGGIECAGSGYGSGPLGCGWGAFYAYSSSGLSIDSSNGWATFSRGGYASGLGVITAYDLQSAAQGTPIAHALMLTTNCTTDNSSNSTPQIYPSFGAGSDAPCPDTELTYGALVHLTLSPAQIAATGASRFCQYILDAAATYGMYVTDNTGNPYGASIEMQSPSVYDQAGQPNYFTSTVEPSLLAGGDASGSVDSYPSHKSNFGWSTCLNRVWNAGDWEVLHITTNTAGLPPKFIR